MTDVLSKVRSYFEYSVESSQYSSWKDLATESYLFYDGAQWTKEETEELKSRMQPPVVVNKIAPKIDGLYGIEKQNSTIIGFRPRTFQPEDRVMAEAFTNIASNWQEAQDSTYQNSQMFKDSLIGGLGWTYTYSTETRPFQHERVDSFEMVWDVDDLTPDLSNQRFVARIKWADIHDVKQMFPSKIDQLDELMKSEQSERITRTSIGRNGASRGAAIESYMTDNGNQLLVVEVQYRVPTTAYEFIDENNRYKRVFNKKYAEKNKRSGGKIVDVPTFEIKYAFYTADILLDEGALSEQDAQFQYIPMVYKRDKLSGMPYGIVENAKDIQREINKRRSKMMHLLSTNQVMIEGDTVNDFEALREEVARPDGILTTAKGRLQLNTNLQLANGQQVVYQQSNQELQDVMGVFDESLGAETNATSGVAIGRRDAATQRTNAVAFDQLKMYKKNFGRKMMSLIQNMDSEIIAADISGMKDNPLGEDVILLNNTYKVGRKEVKEYDVKTANFDIYVEESPAYDAPPAEAAERLINLLNSPQLLPILASSPELMATLGIRNPEIISSQIKQALGGQQAASPDEQGAAPQPVGQPT